MRLSIKVVPGSSRDAVVGWLGDALKIRVTAPATGGQANRAVEKLLSATLDLPLNKVRIVAGGSSPRKVVAIDALSETEVSAKLEDAVR